MLKLVIILCLSVNGINAICSVPTHLDLDWLIRATDNIQVTINTIHTQVARFIDVFKEENSLKPLLDDEFTLNRCPTKIPEELELCGNLTSLNYLTAFQDESNKIDPSFIVLIKRIFRRAASLIRDFRVIPVTKRPSTSPSFGISGLDVFSGKPNKKPFTLFTGRTQDISEEVLSTLGAAQRLGNTLFSEITVDSIQEARFVGLSLPIGFVRIIVDVDDLLHRILDMANRMISVAGQRNPSTVILGHLTVYDCQTLRSYCRGINSPLGTDVFTPTEKGTLVSANVVRVNGELAIQFSTDANSSFQIPSKQLSNEHTSNTDLTPVLIWDLVTEPELITVGAAASFILVFIITIVLFIWLRKCRSKRVPSGIDLRSAVNHAFTHNPDYPEQDELPLQNFHVE